MDTAKRPPRVSIAGSKLVPIHVDLGALARAVAPLIEHRPLFVSQRNSVDVLGMPRKTFCLHCREGAWPFFKLHRVLYAKLTDVVAFIERHPQVLLPKPPKPSLEGIDDAQERAIARVGGRRVAR